MGDKVKCRKCLKKLKDTTIGKGEMFGMFGPTYMYCGNKKCEYFGFITVAGIEERKK